jgi:tRNA pseudouridine13 synthase
MQNLAPAPAEIGLPDARFRCAPSDFVVDELPAYEPSGRGEHLFVRFRKTGLTTPEAVRRLAEALEVDARGAGHAGMKDRHAVTTQTVSFPLPIARDADAAMAAVRVPDVEVLAYSRHDGKLKPGHLAGNRFRVVLRGVAEGALEDARARFAEIARTGVPNAFGPQRFGRDGSNPARAIAWLAGKERGPRDKRDQRMLFSSLQSLLFNRVLERRVAEGTFARIVPGDLAKKHDTGGLFAVPLEGPELHDAMARADAGQIAPTGPMFGTKMRWPEGAPLAMEREVLATFVDDPARLEAFRHLGEGTRRSLRLEVSGLEVGLVAPEHALADAPPGLGVVVSFVLPKGGYATTVLGRVFRLIDASSTRAPREAAATPPEEPTDDDA